MSILLVACLAFCCSLRVSPINVGFPSCDRFEHNYEDDFFEHNRIDAVAMERLTSSPHVINVFGFCGHSVLTEFGDGSRVGELADKSRKSPMARLKIASDNAMPIAGQPPKAIVAITALTIAFMVFFGTLRIISVLPHGRRPPCCRPRTGPS